MIRQVLGLRINFMTFFLKGLHNPGQGFLPGRPVESSFWREISTAIKWFSLRGKKNIQWPSAAAGHGLYRIHINMIEVRPLFPVYFNIDEMLIHDRSRGLVFKTFPLHNMAPMASRIANTYQDGFIIFFRFVQCLISPGIPVNRIMGMLQQVRTGLMNKMIAMLFHT